MSKYYFLVQEEYKNTHEYIELVESIRFDKFLGNNRYEIISRNPELYNNVVIPFGSVEFVESFLRFPPNPLNIPVTTENYDKIKPYLGIGRSVGNVYVNSGSVYYMFPSIKHNNRDCLYVKSADRYKKMPNTLMKPEELETLPKGRYFIQTEFNIPIFSEYRVFVFRNKIVDIGRYLGGWEVNLDFVTVRNVIDILDLKLPAYALDFVVLENSKTYLLEAHHFYSCGIYGASLKEKYATMLVQSFLNLK